MSLLKITLSAPATIESTSAGANPYLSEDGMINFVKMAALQERVSKVLKAAAKSDEPIKVLSAFVMKRRAKPQQYRAAAATKGDLKYLAGRAIKIAARKRVTPEALGRVAYVLQVIDDAKLNAALKQAQTAIARHMKKTEGVLTKVSKEKGKLRDNKNATFDKSCSLLQAALIKAEFKPSDLAVATGMMGKTVLIRLGPDNYVSVVAADKARFAAAAKAMKG